MMLDDIRFCEVTWQEYETALRQIRYQVFVCEHRFLAQEEFDRQDPSAWHILVFNQHNLPIGTGRLTAKGRLGRIAVLMDYRDQGIGSEIVRRLILLAKFHHIESLEICPELGLQKRFAELTKPTGPVFMESGIPHQSLAWANLTAPVPDLHYLH